MRTVLDEVLTVLRSVALNFMFLLVILTLVVPIVGSMVAVLVVSPFDPMLATGCIAVAFAALAAGVRVWLRIQA